MKKVFMGDLHSHLRRCGYFNGYNYLGSSKEAIEENYVKKARNENFDFLGISFTDDSESWYREMVEELARKYDGKDGFLLLTGEEVQAEWGHIVSLGNPPLSNLSDISMERIVEEKSKEGIIIAAHPQGYWKRELFLEYDRKGYFDCLEFGPWGGYDLTFIVEHYIKKIKEGKKFSVSGSSDIHCQPKMLNTLGRTFVIAKDLSRESIIKAVRGGNCLGSFFEYLAGDVNLCEEYVGRINKKYNLNLRILSAEHH
jgi:hypothetical protein